MILGGFPALASWENEGGRGHPTPPTDPPLALAAFRARFFPDARRHDYPSIVAYDAYRHAAEPDAP
jgi:hypothetical protein